ncbi:MAG TPA: GNAT family N-acetyltransferase [Candidatus Acidoferrum sp.]|nr:GNAT family N-acetyltransferase [Candidatus Acidoferrum sp.]
MTATLPANPALRPLRVATTPFLALNNAHATELSPLTLAQFDKLIRTSFAAVALDDAAAFLIALDQTAGYDSPNFLWFRERYDRFVYVDRVVTSPLARGKGFAKALYADLFQRAKDAGHSRIVCEVNLVPPNPASDAFHANLGFAEVGRASVHDGAKTVRYLLRSL